MPASIDSGALQAVFDQPRPDGAFEGGLLHRCRDAGARRTIFLLAFAPKAAGTYFRQAAMHALAGRIVRISHAQGGRDGTPYLPTVLACLLDADGPDTVTHIHMQAHAANRHFMEAFGLKPAIMIRNVPDMLASFWDMLESDPVARAEGLNCQVPDNFPDLSRALKADFMIDIIAPWYASYFATWKTYVDDAPGVTFVMHYKEFCAEPASALHGALAHAGFVVSRSRCNDALERVWNTRSAFRYNKGEQGRGASYFSPDQLERLSQMFGYYPQLKSWLPELMGKSETARSHLENVISAGFG